MDEIEKVLLKWTAKDILKIPELLDTLKFWEMYTLWHNRREGPLVEYWSTAERHASAGDMLHLFDALGYELPPLELTVGGLKKRCENYIAEMK